MEILIQAAKIGGCVLGGALVVLWIAGIFMKGQQYFLYQPTTGQSQKVKEGYSYPYAFFGPFVPLFLGHVPGFFLTLVIEVVTLGFGRLVLTFLYNGMYSKWLKKKGYIRTDVEDSLASGPVSSQKEHQAGDRSQNQVGTARRNQVGTGQSAQSQSGSQQGVQNRGAVQNGNQGGQAGVSYGGQQSVQHWGAAQNWSTAGSQGHSFSPSMPADGFNGGAYQNTNEVFQPANARFEDEDDEGETMALSGGSIQGISGMYKDAVIPMKIDETVMIGRDSSRSNLVIEEKSVSRRHCAIRFDTFNGTYQVRDYSTYGVFLEDGTKLPSDQEVELKPGTKIRLGSTEHVFLLN